MGRRSQKRSTSRPIKAYAKLSQRQMTQQPHGDRTITTTTGTTGTTENQEQVELERLERLLRDSTAHLLSSQQQQQQQDNDSPDTPATRTTTTRPKRKHGTTYNQHGDNGDKEDPPAWKILARQDLDEWQGMSSDEILVLTTTRKKQKQTNQTNQTPTRLLLTQEELKQAMKQQKQLQRKVQQLQVRQQQQQQRTKVYQQLQHHAQTFTKLTTTTANTNTTTNTTSQKKTRSAKKAVDATLLLRSSSQLQRDKHVRRPITTTTITTQDTNNHGATDNDNVDNDPCEDTPTTTTTTTTTTVMATNDSNQCRNRKRSKQHHPQHFTRKTYLQHLHLKEQVGLPLTPSEHNHLYDTTTTTTTTAAQTHNHSNDIDIDIDEEEDEESSFERDHETHKVDPSNNSPTVSNKESSSSSSSSREGGPPPETTTTTTTNIETSKPALSLAAQMMQSLTQLQQHKSSLTTFVINNKDKDNHGTSNLADLAMEEPNKKSRYVPPTPVVLKTAASLGMEPDPIKEDVVNDIAKHAIVTRSPELAQSRMDLPVAAMEFEIMDAIRNHDITIVCGETGSGKSTQIPQYLYEANLTRSCNKGGHYKVGITQPRRVAAISTAKRVCYELGQGDGQSIRNGKAGNLVAYQTRYETAGLGGDTHLKFMTDGILLQEIHSDFLLRQYSVIVLDEAHERNLNTDVLIGLLSAAIPLRKQAALEDPDHVVPLKLVIMSATLRVKDFTDNTKLFAKCEKPVVVTVPGRTFPVTIHHSKHTELDNYEDVAFQKICKIHRKLPQGGILVFLTGKQEILRMVARLRRALCRKRSACRQIKTVATDAVVSGDQQAPREMDDEELDGDFFRDDEEQEDDDYEESMDTRPTDDAALGEGGIPSTALILPLFSLLSVDDQAKIFEPVPEGHRLIVVATNVAETSITIPGISYVVDSGRQKCRNYNAGTGIASYDIMWISKAAADQRAGRAGRTGPGHCYRLYSSSLFSRHMDAFPTPEVLVRPLEDVVLAMKAMNISSVASFPFPTSPSISQLRPALRILADLGCIDISGTEERQDLLRDKAGGDGTITRLGNAVAKLPLGVRYGKMLIVAAEAGVLDYAIATVAALSEQSPFIVPGSKTDDDLGDNDGEKSSHNDDDPNEKTVNGPSNSWKHKGGDALAVTLAAGAYAFAGRGAGGASEKLAYGNFCKEHGLNPVVMLRIHKMRKHLARLVGARLSRCASTSTAARTGGIISSMPPPNKLQERLLRQSIASGLLDHIAMLAPLGSIPGEHPYSLRTAYIGCTSKVKEPLFMDRNSVIFSRDSRRLPQWVCFDSLVRKNLKDGIPTAVMKTITPIDASWLGSLASGSRLLSLGDPIPIPLPSYDREHDSIVCCVKTMYGAHRWEIPPVTRSMHALLLGDSDTSKASPLKRNAHFEPDDSYRWFARFLLEGKIFPEIKDLNGAKDGTETAWNDSPSIITRRTAVKKVVMLVSALSGADIDSRRALQRHWAEVDDKFLFKVLKHWVKADSVARVQKLWIKTVREQTALWCESKKA